MLSALIKTENSVSNILGVITDARGGEQFLINPPPGGSTTAFPSVAETTLQRYVKGDDSTKGSDTTGGSFIERKCVGCSLAHPWSRKEKGQFVVVGPNANKPGIREQLQLKSRVFRRDGGASHPSRQSARISTRLIGMISLPSIVWCFFSNTAMVLL